MTIAADSILTADSGLTADGFATSNNNTGVVAMASSNISFDTIPASIRKPGVYAEFNTRLAVNTLPGNLQTVLIIGQRLAAGTVAADVPTFISSDVAAAGYFGQGSLLHRMCRAAIRANPYLSLTAIAVDDAAGSAAATATITITGTVTSPGLVTYQIGDTQVQLAVAAGDTASVIAAALQVLCAAQLDLPVTFAVAANVITATARNKGTLGNELATAAATTAVGITIVPTAFTGGLVDPDIAPALAAVFAAGHNIIVTPYATQTSLGTLRTHLDNASDAVEKRGAIGMAASTGTLSAATTLAGQINDGRVSLGLLPGCTTPSYEIASSYGAVVAFEEDPARPLNTLVLNGVSAPAVNFRLSRAEQENALNNGVTPFEVGPGENVQIVRAITTYTLSPLGIPDISLFDLTTIRTLDYVRKACVERVALRFPREKLSNRTPPKVRSELLDVLTKLEDLEIVENVDANKAGLLVERDLQDPNRLDVKIPTDVVNGLHVFAARIDLIL
jgi:Mu-like prophage tail sheath protein gpL